MPTSLARTPGLLHKRLMVASLGMKVGESLSLLVSLELQLQPGICSIDSPKQAQLIYSLFASRAHALLAGQVVLLKAGRPLVAPQI